MMYHNNNNNNVRLKYAFFLFIVTLKRVEVHKKIRIIYIRLPLRRFVKLMRYLEKYPLFKN